MVPAFRQSAIKKIFGARRQIIADDCVSQPTNPGVWGSMLRFLKNG
jgi:hypothetical protein